MPSIPEQLINEVFAELPNGTLTAIGRRESATNAGSNRVVAIPLGSNVIDPPDQPGFAGYSDQGRCLLLRRFQIEWQCHGVPDTLDGPPDFTNAETLFLATLIAVRQLFHNSVRFGQEIWLDQQEDADSFERFGTVIKFVSTIDIRVYEPLPTIVTLTANPKIVTTVQLNDDPATVIINQGIP